MVKKDYFCVGKIVGSRGLNGELKVEARSDFPEDFYDIKNFFVDINDSPLIIENIRIHKSQVLMKIKDINDKKTAENMRGKLIYAFKKDIPIEEGRYFIEDLKGSEIINARTGEHYGILKDVWNSGATDIYSIESLEGKEYLLPIIEGTIDKIDLENEEIFIIPIKGVFDGE